MYWRTRRLSTQGVFEENKVMCIQGEVEAYKKSTESMGFCHILIIKWML